MCGAYWRWAAPALKFSKTHNDLNRRHVQYLNPKRNLRILPIVSMVEMWLRNFWAQNPPNLSQFWSEPHSWADVCTDAPTFKPRTITETVSPKNVWKCHFEAPTLEIWPRNFWATHPWSSKFVSTSEETSPGLRAPQHYIVLKGNLFLRARNFRKRAVWIGF